jgi:hypothetical protein
MTPNPNRRARVWLSAAAVAIAALPSALPAVAHADTDGPDLVANPSLTQAYSGALPTLYGPNTTDVFASSDIIHPLIGPAIPFVDGGKLDQMLRQGSGDLTWVDDAERTLFEAVDLPSAPLPEPGGLLLLATGAAPLLGAIRLGAIRRRLS